MSKNEWAGRSPIAMPSFRWLADGDHAQLQYSVTVTGPAGQIWIEQDWTTIPIVVMPKGPPADLAEAQAMDKHNKSPSDFQSMINRHKNPKKR